MGKSQDKKGNYPKEESAQGRTDAEDVPRLNISA